MPLLPDLQSGEIVLLKVDYGDGSKVKTRPVLIISQNVLHQNSNGFVFLGITTKLPEKYMIPIKDDDMETGNLNKTSCVIYDKPIWAEQKLIQTRIGKVKKEYAQKILDLIKHDILS